MAVCDAIVMIVDDEKGLLMLFGGLIRRLGCHVIEIDGGAAAIETLHNETPNLLVLDLAMPEVSGRDVLAYVRQTPRLDDMQVMILTALGPSAVHDEDDILLRSDRWVNKPVRPSALLAIVEEMLGESC